MIFGAEVIVVLLRDGEAIRVKSLHTIHVSGLGIGGVDGKLGGVRVFVGVVSISIGRRSLCLSLKVEGQVEEGAMRGSE